MDDSSRFPGKDIAEFTPYHVMQFPNLPRTPEPELMDDEEQARVYAEADFSEPHDHFVTLFGLAFPGHEPDGTVLDLGCGPADVSIRFCRRYGVCRLHGIDGAPAMLRQGHAAVREAGLERRIRLIEGYLPGATLPLPGYAAVISNSLLHHLADPAVLWASLRRWGQPGAPVLVMDLLRPASEVSARELVALHAADAPDILRRDFFHSLLAAYRPEEIRAQLNAAGLSHLRIAMVSDRHLTVSGWL